MARVRASRNQRRVGDWVFGGVLVGAVVLPLPLAGRYAIVVAALAAALTLAESWWERREAIGGAASVMLFVSPLYARVEGLLGLAVFAGLGWTLWRARRARSGGHAQPVSAPAT